MLSFFKKQKKEEVPQKKSFFERLRSGLSKTRAQLTDGLANLFLGRKHIDDALLEDIETALLQADVGVEVTQSLVQKLTEQLSRSDLKDPQVLLNVLKHNCLDILKPYQVPLDLDVSHRPFVLLMVGVNGAGKTTTIGKLAKQFQMQGKKVLLAAGDTFRAAAIEQLEIWGERNGVPVIAQQMGSDSASVIYDAVLAAKARQFDIVIADTAGRLHNKQNLMQELNKIIRVLKKVDPQAPHETLLVLDASCGQNGLKQAIAFHEAAPLSGIAITKMDGTAKGGIIFAIAEQLKLPIRYIGVGETIDDLQPFDAQAFIEALF